MNRLALYYNFFELLFGFFSLLCWNLSLLSAVQAKCPSYDTLDHITYLPDPYDCYRFQRCLNGKPILGHCPPGLQFSPSKLICETPANAGCNAKPKDCMSENPQTTCNYTCHCTTSKFDVPCPADIKFSAELDVFDTSLNIGCDHSSKEIPLKYPDVGRLRIEKNSSNVNYCPDNNTTHNILGNIPHFVDCTKVIRCANGKDHVYSCPVGLYFNPSVQFCDEPEYSGCKSSRDAVNGTNPSQPCPVSSPQAKCEQKCECHVERGSCPSTISFNASLRGYDAQLFPECKKEPMIIDLQNDFIGIIEVNSTSVKSKTCPTTKPGQRVFVPHPTDCGKLVACMNNQEKVFPCPVGLHFSPVKKMCDDPQTAGCIPGNSSITVIPIEELECLSEDTCPSDGKKENIAHITDCTLFCRCEGGVPKMDACSPGLHFDRQRRVCDYPATSQCETKCPKLEQKTGSVWSPATCAQIDSNENSTCKIKCDADFELSGSAELKCTKKGWHGTGGLYNIPSCQTPADVGKALMDKINETLNDVIGDSKAALLFVMDESGSVGTNDYMIEKNFATSLVKGFPLSKNRTAGVITFSGTADVDINLSETSTCDFISKVNNVLYSGGSTDIKRALELARNEMITMAKDRHTLVFLITDGISDTNPTDTARIIRQNNGTLFTIGVANYERKQLEPIASVYKDGSPLFFGISSFDVFRVVADYLNTVYSQGSPTCS